MTEMLGQLPEGEWCDAWIRRVGSTIQFDNVRKQDESDARLRAAAPDLLEAAKAVVETVDTSWSGQSAVERLRAAIAKAEGTSE